MDLKSATVEFNNVVRESKSLESLLASCAEAARKFREEMERASALLTDAARATSTRQQDLLNQHVALMRDASTHTGKIRDTTSAAAKSLNSITEMLLGIQSRAD